MTDLIVRCVCAREYLCIREIIISMYASIHLPIYPSIHPSICLSVRLPVCRYMCMHGSGISTSHYISTFPDGTQRSSKAPRLSWRGHEGRPGAPQEAPERRGRDRRGASQSTRCDMRQDCTKHHLVTARSIRIYILYHIMICKKFIRSASSVESL